MSTSTEDANAVHEPLFDPFPEPKTIPSGWNLSALVSDPVPATASQVPDSVDTSTP